MNLNLSLDLNVSEVISPKGNADRQPLWGDDPVERDFEQVLQDELAVADGTELGQVIEPLPTTPVTRQELAAADASSTEQADENTELTAEAEQAALLQLIANARSYEVAVEKNPAASKSDANIDEVGAALLAKELAEELAKELGKDLANTKGSGKQVTEGNSMPPLVTSEQLEDFVLPELAKTNLNEQPQAAAPKEVAVLSGKGALKAESQIIDNQKRSFIEVPADEVMTSLKVQATATSDVTLVNAENSEDAAAAKSINAQLANSQLANTQQTNAQADGQDAAQHLANTSKATTNKSTQDHIAKLVAGDIANTSAVNAGLQADSETSDSAQQSLVSQSAGIATGTVNSSSSQAATNGTIGAETKASKDAPLDSKVNAKAIDVAAKAMSSENDKVLVDTAESLVVKTEQLGGQQKNVEVKKGGDDAAKPVLSNVSTNHSSLTQQGQNTTGAEQVQRQAEVAASPINANQLAAQNNEVEPGTQTVSASAGLSVSTAGSESNQSFAEHQKQQNQQFTGQTATAQAAEQLTEPAEANLETVRTVTTILEPAVSIPVAAQKVEHAALLQSPAAAPVSAMSHSAQASSQVAALQTEKLETLTANLSLLEPNAATQLKDRLMYQLNNKIQSAEVKITPEDLGTVQIKVNLQQEQLSVQFVVQQSNAKELLEQQMPKLKDLLQQQGFQLTEGQVEQRQANDRRSGSEEKSGHRGYAANTNGEVELAHVATVKKQSDRMVDYYA